MAIIKVKHHPELDKDRATKIFAKHFEGRYEVYRTNLLMRDLVVKRSDWTGVGIKLHQEPNATSFVFTGIIPSTMNRVLFGNLIAYVLLRGGWKAMEREVAEFIGSAPEFQ